MKIDEIKCPKCGKVQDYEGEYPIDLITYWGETGYPVAIWCIAGECNHKFKVQECVVRTYEYVADD